LTFVCLVVFVVWNPGEILETATVYSMKIKDEKNFEKFVAQLKPFYFDYKYFSQENQQNKTLQSCSTTLNNI
jgi:hypothetical protein